jgi:NTE family protein
MLYCLKQIARHCRAFLCLFLVGCAGTPAPINQPITVIDESQGYRSKTPDDVAEHGGSMIVLAFSGGGTRAAAFSYGVMQELHESTAEIGGRQVELLSEVDAISSVSGGSFTAAYYGVFGDQLFETYEEDFLNQNIQGALIKRMLNPVNWIKGAFSGFDRTEMAIDYYDRKIFKGSTFADIDLNERPFIEINATDLGAGTRFAFTQTRFDFLCSDLSQFPISRAVTASSAVPVAFPTIVLENHAQECDISGTREWQLLNQAAASSYAGKNILDSVMSYRDYENRPYIHLVDGGISDNLCLRAVTERLEVLGDEMLQQLAASRPENILVILVNAATNPEKTIEHSVKKPSIADTISAVTNAQIARYSAETQNKLIARRDEFRKLLAVRGLDTRVYYSEIAFDSIVDDETSRLFNALPTTLALEDAEVDLLINGARLLLRNNPDYRQFMLDNKGSRNAGAISDDEICRQFGADSCSRE